MEWFDITICLIQNELSILPQVIIIHALSFIIFFGHKCYVVWFSKVVFFIKCLFDLALLFLDVL